MNLGLILCVVFAVLAGTAPLPLKETGFLNRVMTVGGVAYRYQVYVPADWDPASKWPVILFLHGAGERGADGLRQTQFGIGTAIRLHPERFPAVVVMPQCGRNEWWTNPAMEEQALQALRQTMEEFNGDAERVYLTGLSMGGYGTWSLAFKHPDVFAAYVPICGGVRPPPRVPANPERTFAGGESDPYAEVAGKVGRIPVWIFHGADDPVVPVSESRKMHQALEAAGADVRYTEYAGVGHNSWDRAYAEEELYTWLLAARRAP